MSWMVAMLAVLTAQGDGGTSSSVAAFHEPMTRPVPMKRLDWRYPPGAARAPRLRADHPGVRPERGGRRRGLRGGEAAGGRDRLGHRQGEEHALYAGHARREAGPRALRVQHPALGRGRPGRPRSLRRGGAPVVPKQMAESCRGPNAAVCNEVALSLLRPDAGSADLDRAGRLLGAACAAGHGAACAKLERSFVAPALLEDASAAYLPGAFDGRGLRELPGVRPGPRPRLHRRTRSVERVGQRAAPGSEVLSGDLRGDSLRDRARDPLRRLPPEVIRSGTGNGLARVGAWDASRAWGSSPRPSSGI